MGIFNWLLGGRWSRLNRNIDVADIRNGFYPINQSTEYNDTSTERAKLDILLKNPALLTVFCINCDLFSLGKVKIVDENNVVMDSHPLYDILRNPNFFTTYNQFLYDFMFWNMFGNAYCYIDSKVQTKNSQLYFLNNSKIDFSDDMIQNGDKLMLSKNSYNMYQKSYLDYMFDDGSCKKIRFDKVVHITDTSSSPSLWFQGASRIDALYKIVSNSELSLDAKNIELVFSKKYMVAGKASEDDLYTPMLMPNEKSDIETKVMQDRPVTAVRSMIDIKRFVDELKAEGFDKSFIQDVFTIARMYNIPKDVIEVNLDAGAKYENKKHASADHVDYSLKPSGDEFINSLLRYFDMPGKADMSWDHLPFMQVREQQRNDAIKKKAESYKILIDAGMTEQEAKERVGYDVETD